MSKRIQRVNQLIKKELSWVIARGLDLPSGTLVTITRVETLPNLQEARVYVSAVPDKEIKSALGFLKKNVFYLQQALNKRLNMRPVPKIVFVEEKSTKEAARVEKLLEEIKK